MEAPAAIWALVTIAGMYVGSCSPTWNQQVVKPFHTVRLPSCVGGMSQTFDPWKSASADGDGLLNANSAITRSAGTGTRRRTRPTA